MKGNKPYFHIFKKYDPNRIPYKQFSSLFKRKVMSVSVVEASFDDEPKYYSKVLTFCHRKKNDVTDSYVLLYSEDSETGYPDLCLCSCSLNLKDIYGRYLKADDKQQFLVGDTSCPVRITFFSSSPFYHRLFSETAGLVESGIPLKFEENKESENFHWIEFGFTFEGINIFIDCSLKQVRNEAFEKVLTNWNIFLNDVVKKNDCFELPSNYEISFERSVREFLYDSGVTAF